MRLIVCHYQQSCEMLSMKAANLQLLKLAILPRLPVIIMRFININSPAILYVPSNSSEAIKKGRWLERFCSYRNVILTQEQTCVKGLIFRPSAQICPFYFTCISHNFSYIYIIIRDLFDNTNFS